MRFQGRSMRQDVVRNTPVSSNGKTSSWDYVVLFVFLIRFRRTLSLRYGQCYEFNPLVTENNTVKNESFKSFEEGTIGGICCCFHSL